MNGEDIDNDDWPFWRRLIISEMKRLSIAIEKSNDRLDVVNQDVVRLKVWSAIWGFVGGIGATLILQKVIMG